MAKNFGKANSAKIIKDAARATNENANVIQLKTIDNENLVDFPKNHEDCDNTTDLENSMKELGFTDPIEVTAFGMEEGKYTIVSGHRRRTAGVKVGMVSFPCVIKTFDNEHDMRNYVLLANNHRDTAKDPLLYCKRYKMHEEYLKESDFKGSVREEIAKRLGISSQQADRYNQFNKIILPVWDMVRDEVVGMSSVLPMATHTAEEQAEILKIFEEYIAQGGKLTRDVCDRLIKGYREGKKTFAEIEQIEISSGKGEQVRDSGLPLNGFINTEPSETKDPSERNRNDEIRREYDPMNPLNEKDQYADERLTAEDYETIEAVSKAGAEEGTELDTNKEKEKKPPLTEDEKKAKRGIEIGKHLEALEKCFNEFYTFESEEAAELTMRTMSSSVKLILEELNYIGEDYKRTGLLQELFEDLNKSVSKYSEQVTEKAE